MGVARVRPFTRSGTTFSFGENMEMSTYNSFEQSAEDLLLWIKYTKFPLSVSVPEDFVTEMKARGYFTDSFANYLNGIKRFL